MYTAAGTLDREEMVTEYAPLVRRMANHLAARLPPSVQIDDLVQAGLIGLMDAAGRYEQDAGTRFETFATQRIRGAMLDELRQNDWLPRSQRRALKQIETALGRLEQRLGRAPSESEVAREMGMPLAEYQELLHAARGCQLLHLDDFSADGGNDFLDSNCPDERGNPLEQLRSERFRAALMQAIDALPEREKLLMGLYYEQEMTFREIAAILGVTESRVCQLHSQAVIRLRAKLKEW